jgi:hypothetical protein
LRAGAALITQTMSEEEGMPRLLVIIGLVLVVLGALLALGERLGLAPGRLPGDFVFESERWRVVVPLGTSLLVSVLLTIILSLVMRR